MSQSVGQSGWGIRSSHFLVIPVISKHTDVLSNRKLQGLPRVLETETKELGVVAQLFKVNERESCKPE